MIISHKCKYIFIEVPETGSWAIRNELCQWYAGESILHKHASYNEYYRIAERDCLDYFVFATVRNPLDCLVSRYVKYLFPKDVQSKDEMINNLSADYSDFKKGEDIHAHNLSFTEYFKKYHKRPIGEMIDYSRNRLNYVIHYENLQEDFTSALDMLHITPVRPVPFVNKTQGKDKPYFEYYRYEIIPQAKRVCGPFMKRWGYEFPENWGRMYEHTWFDEVQYVLLNALKYLYMTNIRYNNTAYSKALRRLRALLFK